MPLLSVGAAFTVAVPSAFVSLSSTTMQTLSTRARLRIISAGTTHNLILWVFLAALSSTAISSFLWSILGYVDVGHYARVISAVDVVSCLPLQRHLQQRDTNTVIGLPSETAHAHRRVDHPFKRRTAGICDGGCLDSIAVGQHGAPPTSGSGVVCGTGLVRR